MMTVMGHTYWVLCQLMQFAARKIKKHSTSTIVLVSQIGRNSNTMFQGSTTDVVSDP